MAYFAPSIVMVDCCDNNNSGGRNSHARSSPTASRVTIEAIGRKQVDVPSLAAEKMGVSGAEEAKVKVKFLCYLYVKVWYRI